MRFYSLILLELFLASCSNSMSEKDVVMRAADEFFTTLSVPTPENQKYWGMSEFRVFGRDTSIVGIILSDISKSIPKKFDIEGIGAGTATSRKITDSPIKYEVVIPFWVYGKDLAVKPLKLSRDLYLTLELTGGKYQVQNYEFRNDKTLTFQKQRDSAIFATIIVAFIILSFFALIMVFVTGGNPNSKFFMILFVIVMATVSIYVGSVCFADSITNIIAGVVGILIYGFVWAMFRRLRGA